MKKFNIKPVRIRFSFGSNECTTLEQLRNSFSPKAIYEAFPQLLRWLGQNRNEEIKGLLEVNQGKIFQNSETSLFLLYSIFFRDLFESKSVSSLSELFMDWFSGPERNTKSYKYLCKEIAGREWGDLFFLKVSMERLSQTGSIKNMSQDDIYDVYKSICSICDFFKEIHNLSELYIYLMTNPRYLSEYVALDKKIRTYNWKEGFYFKIMPDIYSSFSYCKNHSVVKIAKLSYPFFKEEDLFKFYDYYLHDLLKASKIDNLVLLYIYILLNYGLKSDNTQNLRSMVLEQNWYVNFYSAMINELLKHQGFSNSNNYLNKLGLSKESADELYNIYNVFLNNYLVDNSLFNLEELYTFWANNEKCRNNFSNLHKQIVKAKWGKNFLNNNVKQLLIEYNESSTFSKSKTLTDIDETNLYAFFSKHFDYYLLANKINNIAELYIRISKDNDYCECFDCLEKILYANNWGVEIILDIYNSQKTDFGRERWINIFKNMEKNLNERYESVVLEKGIGTLINLFANKVLRKEVRNGKKNDFGVFENIYCLAKIYINDFGMLADGYGLLLKLERVKYSSACSFLNSLRDDEHKVDTDFSKNFIQNDKFDWEQYPDGVIYYESNDDLKAAANTIHEKWILKTQALIHQLVTFNDTWKKLSYVVDYMRELVKKSDTLFLMGCRIDESPKYFFNAFTDKTIGDRDGRERLIAVSKYSGGSFLEVRFVYALIGLNHYDYKTRRAAMDILESIRNIYPVASFYLDNKSIPNISDAEKYCFGKLIDGGSEKHHLKIALKSYCRNMPDLF